MEHQPLLSLLLSPALMPWGHTIGGRWYAVTNKEGIGAADTGTTAREKGVLEWTRVPVFHYFFCLFMLYLPVLAKRTKKSSAPGISKETSKWNLKTWEKGILLEGAGALITLQLHQLGGCQLPKWL